LTVDGALAVVEVVAFDFEGCDSRALDRWALPLLDPIVVGEVLWTGGATGSDSIATAAGSVGVFVCWRVSVVMTGGDPEVMTVSGALRVR
jgi:hypothetical protein